MVEINLDDMLFFKVFNILNYVFLSVLLLSTDSINKFIYFFQKKKRSPTQNHIFRGAIKNLKNFESFQAIQIHENWESFRNFP